MPFPSPDPITARNSNATEFTSVRSAAEAGKTAKARYIPRSAKLIARKLSVEVSSLDMVDLLFLEL
jgi:hypothetical protein